MATQGSRIDARVFAACFAIGCCLTGCSSKKDDVAAKPQPSPASGSAAAEAPAPLRDPKADLSGKVKTPLGFGKDIDSVLETRCDESRADVKTETLSAHTAALVGCAAGEVHHFRCNLKGDIGVAKWDECPDAGLYSISVAGDALKPGNQWSKNHFAKLGAEFIAPILSAAGKKKLEEHVADYSSKPPEAAHWEIDNVIVDVDQVRAGELQGKWVMFAVRADELGTGIATSSPDHANNIDSPAKLVETQASLAGHGSPDAWRDLLTNDIYAVGTAANEVLVGHGAVAELLSREVTDEKPFASPRIRTDGGSALIEIDSTTLRISEVATSTDRGWKLQAAFLSVPISDAKASALLRAGKVPPLADAAAGAKAQDQFTARLVVDTAGADALAAACASSTDVLALGSAPEESWSDPKRAASVIATWRMNFEIRGGIRTGSSTDRHLAWMATNLRSHSANGSTQDYRAFFVYRLVGDKPQLALAHFSLSSPDSLAPRPNSSADAPGRLDDEQWAIQNAKKLLYEHEIAGTPKIELAYSEEAPSGKIIAVLFDFGPTSSVCVILRRNADDKAFYNAKYKILTCHVPVTEVDLAALKKWNKELWQ